MVGFTTNSEPETGNLKLERSGRQLPKRLMMNKLLRREVLAGLRMEH